MVPILIELAPPSQQDGTLIIVQTYLPAMDTIWVILLAVEKKTRTLIFLNDPDFKYRIFSTIMCTFFLIFKYLKQGCSLCSSVHYYAVVYGINFENTVYLKIF